MSSIEAADEQSGSAGHGRTTISVGRLSVQSLDESLAVDGGSTTGVDDLQGTALLYRVTCSDWSLVIGDYSWSNGERDVHVFDRGDAAQCFDRLRTRCRMSVNGRPEMLWSELSQARIDRGDIPSARKADLAELSIPLAGEFSARDTLVSVGAFAVGTREEVMNETHNRRGYVCVTFPPAATLVAPIAYVISRIAPLAHGLTV